MFALLALLLVTIGTPRLASRIAGVAWSRMICYMTPVFVAARGREHIDRSQSYVIVANHQSVYDIVALYGWLGIDFRWVMKQELRKVPMMGVACAKIGHIFIDRSNTKRAVESLDAAKQIITNGTSVIFFPEGTRSKTGELGKFKKGAFKMAVDLGLPVLPVTISGTRDIVQTKSLLIFPGRAAITIHPPVPTDGKSAVELSKEVRELMAATLE